jgi:hypothetical protein
VSDESDRRDVIQAVHAEGVAAAESLGEGLSHKADRRDLWRVGVVAACLSAAVAIIVSLVAAYQIVDLEAQRTAEQARVSAEQERTRRAITALEEANRDLRQRGQQPVSQPADLDSGDAVVAAATARVLANLPPAPMPTSQQVGDAVASYMVTHPVDVSPVRIAGQVSAYLTANPPAAGAKGDRGEKGDQGERGTDGADGTPGHTPTPEEIMAVFNQAAAQNPDLLCAGKGKFTEVRGFVRVPPDVVPQERALWVCLPQ